MIEDIKNMPKIELQLHLDGSVNLDLASKLSNLPLETIKEKMVAKDKCQNLTEYLTKFDFPISLMQTKENLIKIAKTLIQDLENDNVIYAEIRFAPMQHINKGLSLDEIILAILEGLKSEEVKTNLILCLMRNHDYETNLNVINLAEKYLNKGVCAIDLAGDEIKYDINNFQKLFKTAKEKHIPFTIHAGETSSSTAVITAINYGAKRIGHGIKVVNDKQAKELIRQKDILLEVCPTSNVQTNVIDTYSHHPILNFYKKNIPVSINTDNRTVSNITLTEEYIKLYKNFNFTLNDFKQMNIMAINHAFITKEEKEDLLKKIQ